MAGIISKRTVDLIRFQNDIVEVIGSYITLKRAGSAFKALCPFHKEKTPSFSVNPERQIFHCFGCGAGGDVFRFVMQNEGMDFPAAAEMLANRVGIKIEYEAGSGGDSHGVDKNELYDIMEQAAQFYHRILTTNAVAEEARAYLKKRKLPDDVAQRYLIGYAPERWDAIMKWGGKRGYADEKLESVGLVIKSTKSQSASGYYDRFRDRLMFPIRNAQGKVIGFSGRMLKKEEGQAKYVNSPETPLFRKSQVLYGLYEARKDIVEKREALICEGQIDVIRCHVSGFGNAVAAQGTAFTEDHARIAKRSADSVVIVFDSDSAGQTAAIRTAGIFLQSGLAIRVARLPDGADPDSFIRDQGADAFQAVLDKAVSVVEFMVGVWSARENIRTEAGLVRVSKAVLQTAALASNAVLRARMIEEAAGLLSIPPQALEDDLRYMLRQSDRVLASRAARAEESAGSAQAGAEKGGKAGGSGTRTVAGARTDDPPREELELAEHIVASPGLGELVEKYMARNMFEDQRCGVIIYAAVEASREQRDLMSEITAKDDAEGSVARLAAKVQMAPEKTMGSESSRETAVKDMILYIWRRRLRKERADLEHQVKSGGNKEAGERLRQIPFDLKALERWDTGSAIIEIELA